MAFSDTEEARVSLIEDTVNKCLVWLQNTVSSAQFRQLLLVRQTEIDELSERITTIETKIDLILNTLNNIPITRR